MKTNRDKYLMTSHFTLLMREAGICDENYYEILCTSCALLFFSPPFLSLSVFSQTLHTNSFKVFSSSSLFYFFSLPSVWFTRTYRGWSKIFFMIHWEMISHNVFISNFSIFEKFLYAFRLLWQICMCSLLRHDLYCFGQPAAAQSMIFTLKYHGCSSLWNI